MDETGNQMGSISHINIHDFSKGDGDISKAEILPKQKSAGLFRRCFQATCLCLNKKKTNDEDTMMGLPNTGYENENVRY
ncbi:hypothetical protein AVEN_117993-1 [Araneus ventricosus]|uniref:Uncharacterized protein n=1 Tax=Araneus ventricosus TaxID=182803 RepID=A0A4Y2C9U5_ARAVE|nr:hypothetical protein AVEN_117993-1 [Araneus ventricosus]